MRNRLKALMLCLGFIVFSACSPTVGSEQWCAELKMKPKGDWSSNEAANYVKHCLL